MRSRYTRHSHHRNGFTLVELMIVVAMVGILVAVAVPYFSVYRDKGHVTYGVTMANVIQSALANYAVDSSGNAYPTAIPDYNTLVGIVNAHGGEFEPTEQEMGITFLHYTPEDTNSDGEDDSYTMSFAMSGVPTDVTGWCIVLAPHDVVKCAAQ